MTTFSPNRVVSPRSPLFLTALFFTCTICFQGLSQETYAPPTIEELNARIASAQVPDELPQDIAGQVVPLLEKARDARASYNSFEASRAQYEADIAAAPSRLEETTQEIENGADIEIEVDDDMALTEVESLLRSAETEETNARAEYDELQVELSRRSDRSRNIPTLIAAARGKISEIETELAAPSTADESAELRDARETSLRIRRLNRQAEVRAYEFESQSYDARTQLLSRRIELAQLKMDRYSRRIANIREILGEKRFEEVEKIEQEANEIITGVGPFRPAVESAIMVEYEINRAYLEAWGGPDGTIRKIETLARVRTRAEGRLEELKARKQNVENQVLASGSSTASGKLLRMEAESLPNVQLLERDIEQRKAVIDDAWLEHYKARDTLRELRDGQEISMAAARALNKVIEAVGPDAAAISDDERQELVEILTELLQNRRTILENLQQQYGEYARALRSLDGEQRSLITLTRSYSDFIAERVLFIRSGTWPNLQTVRDVADRALWIARPDQWKSALDEAGIQASGRPVPYGASLILLLLLVLARRSLKRANANAAAQVSKRLNTRIMWTIRSLLFAILRSAPAPLLLYLVGRAMTSGAGGEFGTPVGAGLMITSLVAGPIILMRNLIRPEGLAQKHFSWPEELCKLIRRPIRMYSFVICSLVFVAFSMEMTRDDQIRESLGRLAFILCMGFILAMTVPFTRGPQSALNRVFSRLRIGERRTLRRFVHLVMVAGPVGLILASLSGYHYTAIRLSVNLYHSGLLVVFAAILAGIANRWIRLTRMALAIEQRKIAREKEREKQREAQTHPAGATSDAPIIPDDELVDLNMVDEQASRLVRAGTIATIFVGVWFVWADMVPALEVLNTVEIGQTGEYVEQLDEDGNPQEGATSQPVSITLLNLITAIFIAMVAMAATKNIPGLLELAVLQRLQLAAGERYAITSLVRYSVAAIGLVLAFNAVGIGWGRVQWLVAALSLGLGFGLQEIFANFVSGIILLFERPIRLGDTVTVGGVNGTVTKIRIRATTITDFDRKDLVVPNREFVTTQLINWTLSDSVLRIVVPVGVSYDGDIRLAHKTLLEVADQNPKILAEPKPQALFMGFGDSTLNFELRVHCGSMEDFHPVRHELHMLICEAFREKDIEIAYPQQDLHIRSSDVPLFDTMKPDTPKDVD